MSNLDPHIPGPETPAGQEVRLAAGLASVLRGHRRPRGFGGPMVLALGAIIVVVAIVIVVHIL